MHNHIFHLHIISVQDIRNSLILSWWQLWEVNTNGLCWTNNSTLLKRVGRDFAVKVSVQLSNRLQFAQTA